MKPGLPPLIGERVYLRLLTEDDLPLTRAWRNQDDVRVCFTNPAPITEEGHRSWFQAYEGRADDLVFLIVDRKSDAAVGQVSLYRIDQRRATAEYGRLMLGEPAFRGRGFAADASRLILDLAFRTFGLREVVLEVLASNRPAHSLYLRLGFVECGRDERSIRMRVLCPTRRDPARAPLPRRPARRDRPTVLAIVPALMPTVWLCVIRPFTTLHEQGAIRFQITTEYFARERDLEGVDVVVFCRNVEPGTLDLLRAARRLGVKVIYEIDDNFFDISLKDPIGRYHRQPQQLATHASFLRQADLVRTYARPVLEHAKACDARVKLVRAPAHLPARLAAPQDDVPHIVYATSRHSDALASIFVPALRRVLDEVGDGVRVTFWGPPPAGLPERPQVRSRPFESNHRRYLEAFAAAGFDIGLAPLSDDIFHRSKTNNKFREYGACRIAGIYSKVDVYTDSVEHERTGLLVENTIEAWTEAMLRLIRDRALRRQIQDAAASHVRAHYSPERYAAQWLQDLREVLAQPEGADEGRWISEVSVPSHSLATMAVGHLSSLLRAELRRLGRVRSMVAGRVHELTELARLRVGLLRADADRLFAARGRDRLEETGPAPEAAPAPVTADEAAAARRELPRA